MVEWKGHELIPVRPEELEIGKLIVAFFSDERQPIKGTVLELTKEQIVVNPLGPDGHVAIENLKTIILEEVRDLFHVES